MRAFSALLDRLIYTSSRNAKLDLIARYLVTAPDPDRGWVLAALTGELDLKTVKASAIRTMIEDRVDPVLFRMSYDYVGDLAETVSLLWNPLIEACESELSVNDVVARLSHISRAAAPSALAEMMDSLDANGRYALLKLATGGLRLGVSARLAKTALAKAFALDVDDVEQVWHALSPPYTSLFDWAEGRGNRPDPRGTPFFRPFMLAHPLEEGVDISLDDYAAEWKWDGIRVQVVGTGQETRLYSRAGDDITASFPEIAKAFPHHASLDGELLVRGDVQGGEAASFNALQQRLGRKTVSAKMQADYPVFVRLYDIMMQGDEDLRSLSWTERRRQLELFIPALDPVRFDLSAIVEAMDFSALADIRAGSRDAAIEGLMLKRRDSPYVTGRKTGLWYKWKRDPLTADCVMMYAQRGHGKRSSFYSDYTFGCWTEAGELLPVGKAYSGFTDEELKMLDRFVRANTTARYGPVREVEKSLVLEVAFDSIHDSKRHKSGLAMRFPRIARIRTDKPASEADRIDTLRGLIR